MAIEANTGLSGTAGTASSGVTIATWANFPAASSVPSGTVYMASDYNNSEWVSNGAYWKPRGGRQRPIVMAAAVSSTGTTVRSMRGHRRFRRECCFRCAMSRRDGR